MNSQVDTDSHNNNEKFNVNNLSIQTSLSSMFTMSNLMWFLIFLAIYIVLYFLVKALNGNGNPLSTQMALSRSIDIFICIAILVGGFLYYRSLTDYDKDHLVVFGLASMRQFFDSPTTIIDLIILTILFYILVYLGNVPMSKETRPMTIGFLENKLWILIVIQIILMIFKYVFKMDIVDFVLSDRLFSWIYNTKNPISNAEEKDDGNKNDTSAQGDEVFNISNNVFTYDDAQIVCSALDAQLATYDQIESAYNNGAEWCNYGWSADQMAYFPTQKDTWEKLQNNSKHKNDCGRPGINGGYIANPYVTFGVNCYGKKPKPTDAELAAMKANTANNGLPVKTSSLEEKILEAKMRYWQNNASNMLNLSSYNKNAWSQY